MAVGKGSMERASKAIKKPAEKIKEEKVVAVEKEALKKDNEKKASPQKEQQKKTPAKKVTPKKTVAKKAVVANVSEQVADKVIYQPSSQMLDRDAKPNEVFGIGDSMPIYYF